MPNGPIAVRQGGLKPSSSHSIVSRRLYRLHLGPRGRHPAATITCRRCFSTGGSSATAARKVEAVAPAARPVTSRTAISDSAFAGAVAPPNWGSVGVAAWRQDEERALHKDLHAGRQ